MTMLNQAYAHQDKAAATDNLRTRAGHLTRARRCYSTLLAWADATGNAADSKRHGRNIAALTSDIETLKTHF